MNLQMNFAGDGDQISIGFSILFMISTRLYTISNLRIRSNFVRKFKKEKS